MAYPRMKTIPLTQGAFAIVDDEDFERVSRFKWHLRRKRKNSPIVYAVRDQRPLSPAFMRMHHLVLGVSSDTMVDHRDGNGLNNQRSNLRFCNGSQNNGNRRLSTNSVSGYKGVSWCAAAKKWRARLANVHLGVFSDPKDAADVYDNRLIAMFGEFALTNQMIRAKSP